LGIELRPSTETQSRRRSRIVILARGGPKHRAKRRERVVDRAGRPDFGSSTQAGHALTICFFKRTIKGTHPRLQRASQKFGDTGDCSDCNEAGTVSELQICVHAKSFALSAKDRGKNAGAGIDPFCPPKVHARIEPRATAQERFCAITLPATACRGARGWRTKRRQIRGAVIGPAVTLRSKWLSGCLGRQKGQVCACAGPRPTAAGRAAENEGV